jgi:hypothetical protein
MYNQLLGMVMVRCYCVIRCTMLSQPSMKPPFLPQSSFAQGLQGTNHTSSDMHAGYQLIAMHLCMTHHLCYT